MSLKSFLAQNAIKPENKKVVISNRFIDENGNSIPWEIRAINEGENENLRRSCTSKKFIKGQPVNEFNSDLYLKKLVASSVVFPDLKDSELQASYNVLGAEDLLDKMLLSGEFAQLIEVIHDVSGLKDINELKEEAKN